MLVFTLFAWWLNGGQYRALGGAWKGLTHDITVSNETKMLSTGGDRDYELLAVPYTFFTFSTGFSMGPSVQELQVSRSITALRPFAPLLVTLGILFGSLLILGLIAVKRQGDTGIFVMVWLVLPIIGASLVSAFTDMAYNVRYVSMALPAYILILAAGIAWFGRPVVRMTLLSIVLLVNGLSLSNYYFDSRYAREDSRSAAQYLESAARTQDIIVVVGNTRPLRYYYEGNVPIVSWSKKANSGQSAVAQRLKELGSNYDRLWLVQIRQWQEDPTGNVKKVLGQLYTVTQSEHFTGVDIHSYRLRT